jgi:alcohol dehydrogenase class IV
MRPRPSWTQSSASKPPAVTAATGFGTLTHATESYLAEHPNPWPDGIAWQVIRLAAGFLPSAVADGADLEAREAMLLAAHMAGIAMANTGLGIAHALAAAIDAVAALREQISLTRWLADFGVTAADYPRIAAILGLPGDPRQLRLGLQGDQPAAGDPAKLAVDPGEQVPARRVREDAIPGGAP